MSKFQLLPALAPEEEHSLMNDIEARGVLVPIMIDERNEIIDGHHRKAIADHLGVACPTVKCPPNLSDADKRTLALGMNLHRRQMNREQKREAIAKSLIADPQLSDRQHAERIGTTHPTVAAVRAELVKSGDVENLSTRTDTTGRDQPSSKPPVVTITERDSHSIKTEYPAPPSNVDGHTGEIASPGQTEAAAESAPIPSDSAALLNETDFDKGEANAEQVPLGHLLPKLTPEERRAADLAEADARTARYVQKAISNWPALYGLRTNPRREQILAHLCESDLAYLADIEGKLQ